MGDKSRGGAANANWRGGRTVDPRGYVLLRRPEHPRADVRGYVYERLVEAEAMLGRPLAPGERVRHRNGDVGDSSWENLRVVPLRDRELVACACGCGEQFERTDRGGRPRRYVSGHNAKRNRPSRRRSAAETRSGLPAWWRAEQLEAVGGRCAYGCGRPATHWDHLVAFARGGSFRRSGNAVPCCLHCNARKSDGEPWPWIDRGMAAHPDYWMDLVALALEWGSLESPDDDLAVANG